MCAGPRHWHVPPQRVSMLLCNHLEQESASLVCTVICDDSYRFLLRHFAPSERSLVLVDPPCEPYDLYMAWSLHLMAAAEHWPSSTVILWYPLMDPEQVAGLYQQAASLGLPLLVAEFQVTCENETALEKSGVFILNPAAASVRHLKDLLSKLASKLAEGRKDAASVDATSFWLHERKIVPPGEHGGGAAFCSQIVDLCISPLSSSQNALDTQVTLK
ncbi:unnamed protein product [Cladocopium goreaui]|uniref:Ribosomal RNA large subunit methyltransferase J n=2 Tax=Cladocopium goreaui TaxID=2562237 RepID=A0A9P1BNL8_9DINO|nr:unnamed protein product [Cladocopium goreaui]